MRHFNDNILLEEQVFVPVEKLAENQYYALMVEDSQTPSLGDNRKFFDVTKGWLGLEQTSEKRIYISKSFRGRNNPYRGTTFTVRVKDVSLCCVLN